MKYSGNYQAFFEEFSESIAVVRYHLWTAKREHSLTDVEFDLCLKYAVNEINDMALEHRFIGCVIDPMCNVKIDNLLREKTLEEYANDS